MIADRAQFEVLIRPHLRDLRAHCYRMMGSVHDADDALRDALVRAWRGLEGFEERASLRTWLHRIATLASLDVLERQKVVARSLPAARAPASKLGDAQPAANDELAWLEPCPDSFAAPEMPDAAASGRESIALAFLVMLQELPPRQRAVLLLRDVVGLPASEVAEALGATVAATNSVLARARQSTRTLPGSPRTSDEGERDLLTRYIRAWESADVAQLVTLLHAEAKLSMPPLATWYQGPDDIAASLTAMVLPPTARGEFRGLETRANGLPAVGMYRHDGDRFVPFAFHILRLVGAEIAEIVAFLDPRAFGPFALPSSFRA